MTLGFLWVFGCLDLLLLGDGGSDRGNFRLSLFRQVRLCYRLLELLFLLRLLLGDLLGGCVVGALLDGRDGLLGFLRLRGFRALAGKGDRLLLKYLRSQEMIILRKK